jgi:copper oxidase (laccase) domain-containing protein
VVTVDRPGEHGDADALVTRRSGVPLAVFTADCLGIVLLADGAVGVAHAGWRGVAAGIVERAVERVEQVSGSPVDRMAVGPHIGPCCFEVGPEVAARFPDTISETTWGTLSVDLPAEVERRTGRSLDRRGGCTMCGDDAFSHRRTRDSRRMAAIGWLP